MKKVTFTFLFLLCTTLLFAQTDSLELKTNKLDEVILNSTRIDLPLSQHSRTIQVLDASDIQKSGAPNVVVLLQQISGIDIRQRGVEGMQADLYIRGGSFDQTLLLIDGIKLEDAQTGHHTLNLLPPIDLIERIEVLKGPAARIYGQNAFTGAVNIVTKVSGSGANQLAVQGGSYDQYQLKSTLQTKGTTGGVLGHFSYNTSNGYRHNTDFINRNYFIKGNFETNEIPFQFLGYFSDREFGANGFYASPLATEQYEETQGSLVALSAVKKTGRSIFKPRIYWRRGQDMYVFIRDNPSVYRNLHITNKAGVAVDYSLFSFLGTTGIGVDFARVGISSNNLGDHSRYMTTIFAEHRFLLLNDKLDITPGLAYNYYTDFGSHFFPGIDFGVAFNSEFRVYGNIGSTYRIPTYTDLFYSDSTTLGNANLKPESAVAIELGLRYTSSMFSFSAAYFNRNSEDLIDYVKDTADAKWEANNIQEVTTGGFELESTLKYNLSSLPQNIRLGYTYIDDDVKGVTEYTFSRYSINSLKNHFTIRSLNQWSNSITSGVVLKVAERTLGEPYTVLDFNAQWTSPNKAFRITFLLNNLFDEVYTETNLVPMPERNGSLGVQYSF
jgi:iron complex outermembrane receptor protein